MKVSLIAALTADGCIGRSAQHLATTWTSKADLQHFVRISKELHCVVMGLNTYRTIGKGLPGRRTLVYSPEPIDDPSIEVVTEAPAELLRRLSDEGEANLLVCGGATIYNMFLQAGVVDELYLTIEPMLFGTGIRLCTEELQLNLKLLDVQHQADSVFLHYSAAKQ